MVVTPLPACAAALVATALTSATIAAAIAVASRFVLHHACRCRYRSV